jgi:glycosidase
VKDIHGLLPSLEKAMKSILTRIYGPEKADAARKRIAAAMDAFEPCEVVGRRNTGFSQKDAILITYGDSLYRNGEMPLKTLHGFARKHLKDLFSGIHILPFFPYSSDDGFSVTDFHAVRPDLGGWENIRAIGEDFDLMVDLVANHISAQSLWFQSYLAGEEGFEALAIEVDPADDISQVTRPRTHPLLTPFEKRSGLKVNLWTTFSADQIDLNYQSLDVLEKMVKTLLFYVSQGARIIRLDAIAYLWKQIGTACIHLSQTHDLVRLFRRILNEVAPHVLLVTETNVPHEENVGYFGNGTDEAQMVYNFTLPPLLLFALSTGDARRFSDWAACLSTPSAGTTFFNFTASHDGIGVRPLEGILSPAEIADLVDRVLENGGLVSEMRLSDGSRCPYELNTTYLDALAVSRDSRETLRQINRFLTSQAVAMALPGVPAVYIHSLMGSSNWGEGVRMTGRSRTINRERLQTDEISAALSDPRTIRARIFFPYLHMIRTRTRQPAFHPCAGMEILHLDDRVFSARRQCPEQSILVLSNFYPDPLTVQLPGAGTPSAVVDLLGGKQFRERTIPLHPYETLWLTDQLNP